MYQNLARDKLLFGFENPVKKVTADCRLENSLIFLSCVISDSLHFTRKPADPTIVVEGVNSTQVHLVWTVPASSNFFIVIEKQRPGEIQRTHILTRTGDTFFFFESSAADYEANLPSTLVIKEATRNEFVYIFSVLRSVPFQQLLQDTVTVKVLCKYSQL